MSPQLLEELPEHDGHSFDDNGDEIMMVYEDGDDTGKDAHLPPRRPTRSPLEVVRVLSHPKHRVAATKADLKTILSNHIGCFALTMVCGMLVKQNGTAPWNL